VGCFSNPKTTVIAAPSMPAWLDTQMKANTQKANELGNKPFVPYTGQLVAGFNGDQNSAIAQTKGMTGTNVLSGAGNNGSISGVDLSGYMNPFTENVINASDQNLNKQYGVAAADLAGKGTMQAGFGGYGDRAGAASAELASNYANQKNTTDSGLYAANFTNAQGYAQKAVDNQLQGNIANAGINQAATNNLFNMGTAEQATAQAGNDASYSEFMRELNDPYQKLGFAASIANGAAPFYTTQTTTSKAGAPSALQVFGGLLKSGSGMVSLASANGGRVGLAAGGVAEGGAALPAMNRDGQLEEILGMLGQPAQGYDPGGRVRPVEGGAEVPVGATAAAPVEAPPEPPEPPATNIRELNAQFERERQMAYAQNLPPALLSQVLAKLSERHARAASGLVAGANYREPGAAAVSGPWTQGLAAANGQVPPISAGETLVPGPEQTSSATPTAQAAQAVPAGLAGAAPPPSFDDRVLEMLRQQNPQEAPEGEGLFGRISRRMSDPNYAFSRFLLNSGLATLSATGVNGLAANAMGDAHGLAMHRQEVNDRANNESERMTAGSRMIQQHRLGLGAARSGPELQQFHARLRELEAQGLGQGAEARDIRAMISKRTGEGEGGMTAPQLATARARARQSAEQEAGRMHFDTEENRRAWIEDRTEQSYRTDVGAAGRDLQAYAPQHRGPAPVPREAVPAGMVPDWQNPGRTMVAPDSRDLPQHELDLMVNAGSTRQTMEGFTGRFRDEFTNKPLVGGAQNRLGSILPGTPEWEAQGNWWRGYNEWVNQFRNSLFGASLTANEQAAFAASTVDQSMKPDVVRDYLDRQKAVIESAIRRRAGSLAARGVRRTELAEAVGMDPEQLFALSRDRGRDAGQERAQGERGTPAAPAQADAAPKEGDTRTIDGKPAVFTNGNWYEIRRVVPQATPPPGGLGATQ